MNAASGLSTGLVRYDSMVRAIAEAHAVDELKDYRDQARALELYAQQARNREAETKAAAIRIRAEHRCGELLRDMEKAKGVRMAGRNTVGGHAVVPPTDAPTLADQGISKQQSSRWQKLASVPREELDETLAGYEARGEVPSTEGVLRRAGRGESTEVVVGDHDALYIWGELPEVLDHLRAKPIPDLAQGIDPVMRPRFLEVAPAVSALLTQLIEEVQQRG